MRILVLGATGMLGHKMFQTLRQHYDDTYAVVRAPLSSLSHIELFQKGNVIVDFDAQDLGAVKRLLEEQKPAVVVNCIGVIKQRSDAKAFIPSLTLNSLLPHHLAAELANRGGRLIHFSTDCVFSGKKGEYTESDQSDAEDLYGKSKFLGEVAAPNAVTLRTSMIGRELSHFQSLLEWFLRQKSRHVEGFKRAIYSGLTTNSLSKVVSDIIGDYPALSGLYQVTGKTISKFELLKLIQERFGLPLEVVPDEMVHCDRSMVGDKFKEATGFEAPDWPELIDGLACDPTPYAKWTGENS